MLYMEENQIVAMTDSYIIVTGASGSMGKAACRNLVRKGEKVIMACRSVEKAEKAREEILAGEGMGDACLEIKPLDLCSVLSSRKLCPPHPNTHPPPDIHVTVFPSSEAFLV